MNAFTQSKGAIYDALKDVFVTSRIKSGYLDCIMGSWSLWGYLERLDGATRFSVIVAAVVSLYVVFTVIFKYSRAFAALILTLIQMLFVGIFALAAFLYRNEILGLARGLLEKVDL